MKINFTRDLYDIFQDAASEALRTGYTLIGVDHFMLALLRRKGSQACRLLRSMGIDCAKMKDYIDSVIFRPEALPYDALESIRPGRDADKLMCISIYEAIKAGDTAVRPVHVVLAACRTAGSASAVFLYEHGLDYDIVLHYCSSHGLLDSGKESDAEQARKILRAVGEGIARTMDPEDSSKIYPS